MLEFRNKFKLNLTELVFMIACIFCYCAYLSVCHLLDRIFSQSNVETDRNGCSRSALVIVTSTSKEKETAIITAEDECKYVRKCVSCS